MRRTFRAPPGDLQAAGLPLDTVFIRAGYKEKPRKGQWYLSGAVPTAYRAPNDLGTPYVLLLPVTRP